MQFNNLEDQSTAFCAKLIASQVIHKKEATELQDEEFRTIIEEKLKQVGLKLIDNIYSDYYAIALASNFETILEDEKTGEFDSNNIGISRGAMALLTILWSLLILPKREKQTSEAERIPAQLNFISDNMRPIPKNVDIYVLEENFRLEFGHLFGKQNKIKFAEYLNEIVRYGFIKRRTLRSSGNEENETRLYEGPLLDTLIDYRNMIEHIQDGLLSELPEILNKSKSLVIENLGDETDEN